MIIVASLLSSLFSSPPLKFPACIISVLSPPCEVCAVIVYIRWMRGGKSNGRPRARTLIFLYDVNPLGQ